MTKTTISKIKREMTHAFGKKYLQHVRNKGIVSIIVMDFLKIKEKTKTQEKNG